MPPLKNYILAIHDFSAIQISCLRENTQKIEGSGNKRNRMRSFTILSHFKFPDKKEAEEAEIPPKNLYVRT
jgi:hypothetical protein